MESHFAELCERLSFFFVLESRELHEIFEAFLNGGFNLEPTVSAKYFLLWCCFRYVDIADPLWRKFSERIQLLQTK